MRTWYFSFVGALALSLAGACSNSDNKGGAGPGESACEKLCRRAGEANPVCSPNDCLMKCQTAQPKCETEYRAYVACMADAQLLGCDTNTTQPLALGECTTEKPAFESCMLTGTGGTSGTGGTGGIGAFGGTAGVGGSAGTGGVTGPCDPLTASCVGCGAGAPCEAGQSCCYDDPTPTCKPAGTCSGTLAAACDGSEDCPGAKCCVNFSTQQDGSAKSGKAECSAAGSTVCCSPTPGVKGCTGDKTVEQCVCAKDNFCCDTEWDAQCAAQVAQLGCGTCGADCTLSNASTGSGSSIKSVACRTNADCAGLKGQFSVPYSECCGATNFGVRACVSQTYASAIMQQGGSCG